MSQAYQIFSTYHTIFLQTHPKACGKLIAVERALLHAEVFGVMVSIVDISDCFPTVEAKCLHADAGHVVTPSLGVILQRDGHCAMRAGCRSFAFLRNIRKRSAPRTCGPNTSTCRRKHGPCSSHGLPCREHRFSTSPPPFVSAF